MIRRSVPWGNAYHRYGMLRGPPSSAAHRVVGTASSPPLSLFSQHRHCSTGATAANTAAAASVGASSAAPAASVIANGMAFAASPSPRQQQRAEEAEMHVTAWHSPVGVGVGGGGGVDMTIAFNVLRQLAHRSAEQQRQRKIKSSSSSGSNAMDEDFNAPAADIRLTCSFPTLPPSFMALGCGAGAGPSASSSASSSSSAPPSFVASPLLSHLDFITVQIFTPLAQLFAADEAVASSSYTASPRNVLRIPEKKSGSGSSSSGKRGSDAPPGNSQQHSAQPSAGTKVTASALSFVPLTSIAGSAAPAGASEPMTFVLFREGGLVGWNAPWSEMVTFRSLVCGLGAGELHAETEALLHASNNNPSTSGTVGSASSPAASPSPDAAAACAGRALAAMLSARAALDRNSGAVTLSPAPPNSPAALAAAAAAAEALRSAPPVERARAAVWTALNGLTSLVTPGSWGQGQGQSAGGGALSHPSSSSPHSSSASHSASPAASLAASSGGVDSMRYSYFASYPNARAAALERREQLEESGDMWLPGADIVDTVPSSWGGEGGGVLAEASTAAAPAASAVASPTTDSTSTPNGSLATTAPAASCTPQQPLPPLYMRNFVDADRDRIVLADSRAQFKVPFSYALAQSVRLDAIDSGIAPIAGSVKVWQQRLAATSGGQLACGVKALRRAKTRLLTLEEALNSSGRDAAAASTASSAGSISSPYTYSSRPNPTTATGQGQGHSHNHHGGNGLGIGGGGGGGPQATPKVFWAGELQCVRGGYKDACEHLEIESRREALLAKAATVDDALTYLHDEVHAGTMEVLTWVIILLIAFEIAVAFGALHAVSVAWNWLVALVFV